MPRNVATPDQAARASSAVANFDNVRTGARGNMNKFSRTRPLTKFEREALNAPIEAVYLYNISPIFKWQKDYPGLGIISLFPRRADQDYSDPITLAKRLVRTFDGGNRIQRLMVETPLEIVEDFLVCSPDFPGRPENNLTKWGAFYTIGQPIEKFNETERQDILDDAELKHRNKLHEMVASADALKNGPMHSLIGETHKKAALYLNSVEQMELPDWVARRAKLNPTEECPFCGFENKRGIAKCHNCKEVLDVALYAKLQADRKGKEKTS